MAIMKQDTTFLTLAEAAAVLGRCERTARKMADDGRLPVIRTGRGVRLFERAALEAYLREPKGKR